jgi:hypothetical protein
MKIKDIKTDLLIFTEKICGTSLVISSLLSVMLFGHSVKLVQPLLLTLPSDLGNENHVPFSKHILVAKSEMKILVNILFAIIRVHYSQCTLNVLKF